MDHRQLISELYQILGALDAPENVLNQVAAADAGQPLPHETLLPFVGESRAALLQPVAWLVSVADEPELGHWFAEEACRYDGHNCVPLYTAPPVPRDVLIDAMQEVLDECLDHLDGPKFAIDLAAIADRYASKAQPEQTYAADAAMEGMKRLGYQWLDGAWYKNATQPEPVNQQLLALIKSFGHKVGCQKNAFGDACTCGIDAAIAAAEAAQPAAQQYLLGGRRFKVTHSQDHGFAITGLPQTMNGQWVAFVDATDNCHMQQQQPASAQPVAVPDERVYKLLRDLVFFLENSPKFSNRDYYDRRNQLHEDAQLLLSAAQKPEGV